MLYVLLGNHFVIDIEFPTNNRHTYVIRILVAKWRIYAFAYHQIGELFRSKSRVRYTYYRVRIAHGRVFRRTDRRERPINPRENLIKLPLTRGLNVPACYQGKKKGGKCVQRDNGEETNFDASTTYTFFPVSVRRLTLFTYYLQIKYLSLFLRR